jgi:hypothetical protein
MDNKDRIENERRLSLLETELADLRLRWPAHSVKPAMLQQLEELEEEIDTLRKLLSERVDSSEHPGFTEGTHNKKA